MNIVDKYLCISERYLRLDLFETFLNFTCLVFEGNYELYFNELFCKPEKFSFRCLKFIVFLTL